VYSVDCSVTVTLLFLLFKGKHINPSNSPSTIGNEIFVLDTGSDLTYLDATFYDPLINDVHSFITFVFVRLNSIAIEMMSVYCKFNVNRMKFQILAIY